ncbi:hypothetical protein BMS3Bbin04_00333 [bacterium BMS3Bbin04]|nr:hypothetical protein BMS3Bbin04_00333 [bacterium BMS3Bbin04]
MEHGNGDRLLRFASQTLDEGYQQVAAQALDIAAERLRDPEGADVVDLMRAKIAQSLGEFQRSDSLLSVVADDPASARVERSALMSRGLIRLQQLDRPLEAAQDFRVVRKMGWPENDRRLDYYEAIALIRTDSLDAAIIPLQREIPQENLDDASSFGFITESGVVGDTDLNHLAARIMLWTGKREQASALLDSLLNPPVGASAENETLLLLQLITTSQDSIALDLFAEADYARFRGDIPVALTLLDSLALNENTPEQLAVEADYSAAMLHLTQSDSAGAIVEFANRHPEHPRVEEAWYQLGLWWEAKGNYSDAEIAYEMVLMDFPDGLLQSLARLRLEELTVQLFLPDLPAEDL